MYGKIYCRDRFIMKRREKLKDVIELIELYQKRQTILEYFAEAKMNKLDSERRLQLSLLECNDKLNQFLDEEVDNYNISLTKVELANIINILCLHIYNHEENQVQDIIQIKDKLKEILENKNEQIKQ